VIALGSYSTPLLRRIGISIPVYPVKGYSITLPLEPESVAPRVSLTDHARKIVLSRLGDRLRVAGTAELNGYDTEMNEPRCNALVRRCFEWFPRAGHAERAQFWTGLRPATPSNLPLIGRSKYPNLFINTGHGTLGWTLACGSGHALADIVSGRKPEPEFGFLRMEARTKRATSSVAPRPTG
jgi:D-amino-acid dehydrogenase